MTSGPGVFAPPSYGVVIVVVFVLPLQRVSAGVLRRHVGGDEDVLGANQRWVDEDVGDSRRGGRGCGGERNNQSLKSSLWFSTEVLDNKNVKLVSEETNNRQNVQIYN